MFCLMMGSTEPGSVKFRTPYSTVECPMASTFLVVQIFARSKQVIVFWCDYQPNSIWLGRRADIKVMTFCAETTS